MKLYWLNENQDNFLIFIQILFSMLVNVAANSYNARKRSVRITKKISYNAKAVSVNNLIIIPLPIQ